ncbi:mannosyltransferase putative-domain-containing protein [Geranomyces variabilis]|nr:mannosyltransferase putative-domain-containing protein [Geranomyces variabilis]KAJ3142753.1 hypothetical protein HDU90_002624 [Geranomyces variabilis]
MTVSGGLRPWRSADAFFTLPTHSKDKSSLDLWIAEGKSAAAAAAGGGSKRTRRKVMAVLVVFLIVLSVRWYSPWGLPSWVSLRSTTAAPPCGAPICLPTNTALRPLLADSESALRHTIWDWHGLARRARLFRSLLLARYTPEGEPRIACDDDNDGRRRRGGVINEHTLATLDHAIASIEANIYPWVTQGGKYANVAELLASYAGSGIVMTTGNFHADHAVLAIRNIRKLGCVLPVQLFYLDEQDLSTDHRATLAALADVQIISITTLVDVHASARGKRSARLGWEMKPFAILASTFRHAIFIDADVVFLQNPERMLDYAIYKGAGTVLFRDRTLYPGGKPTEAFFVEVMDGLEPSAMYREGRVGRKLSVHEGESGVVVVDKVRNFHALLMTTLMNAPGPYKDDMYGVIHGDKESYWMAHEMLNLPYAWAPGGGGTIGFHTRSTSENVTTICGQLYHPDPSWKPLWMNGGITANKHTGAEGSTALAFSHWATDPDWINVQWEWEKADRPFCLLRYTVDKGRTWNELTEEEKGVLDDAERMWAEIKEVKA